LKIECVAWRTVCSCPACLRRAKKRDEQRMKKRGAADAVRLTADAVLAGAIELDDTREGSSGEMEAVFNLRGLVRLYRKAKAEQAKERAT
jgi:hypothetical protein